MRGEKTQVDEISRALTLVGGGGFWFDLIFGWDKHNNTEKTMSTEISSQPADMEKIYELARDGFPARTFLSFTPLPHTVGVLCAA